MTKIETAREKLAAAEQVQNELQERRAGVMRELAVAENDLTSIDAQGRLRSAAAAIRAIDRRLVRAREEITKARRDLAETRDDARRLKREIETVTKTWGPRFEKLADLERISGELTALTAFPLSWDSLQDAARVVRSLVLQAQRRKTGLLNGIRNLERIGDGGDGLSDDERARWEGRGYEFAPADRVAKLIEESRANDSLAHIQDARAELGDV